MTGSNYVLLAAGVALHTLAMTKRGLTLHSCPVNNLYEATTFLLGRWAWPAWSIPCCPA